MNCGTERHPDSFEKTVAGPASTGDLALAFPGPAGGPSATVVRWLRDRWFVFSCGKRVSATGMKCHIDGSFREKTPQTQEHFGCFFERLSQNNFTISAKSSPTCERGILTKMHPSPRLRFGLVKKLFSDNSQAEVSERQREMIKPFGNWTPDARFLLISCFRLTTNTLYQYPFPSQNAFVWILRPVRQRQTVCNKGIRVLEKAEGPKPDRQVALTPVRDRWQID